MTKPFILEPNQARSVSAGGTRCAFILTGHNTRGRVGMFELSLAPQTPGAGLHFHKELTEAFYVVSGEVTLLLEDERVQASQGAFMFVPPNTPHGFANPGNKPAILLTLFYTPDGREGFFEGLATLAQQQDKPDMQQVIAFMARHDQYLVPQPSPRTDGTR